ncbi:hypothetical protein BH09PSE5_BH09PSE5_26140 [soil metagenome]
MLDKLVYVDPTMTLTIEWLGFGPLKLRTANGDEHIASARAKAYYMKVAACFEEHGQPAVRANRRFETFARQFAAALADEPNNGPLWEKMMSVDPRRVAESYVTIW